MMEPSIGGPGRAAVALAELRRHWPRLIPAQYATALAPDGPPRPPLQIVITGTIGCWSEETYGCDDDDKAQLRRLKELCRRLAADDRAGLAALLHDWEAQTVRNLKIEHLWEPTPFPLELRTR